MTRDDAVYLAHIQQCLARIAEDTAAGRNAFLASHTLQDAVLRNLQVLAESTQHLSTPLKERRPEIEWRQIAAFRNFLVHDYLGVDLEVIWEITQCDLPPLKLAIAALVMIQRNQSP